MYMDKMTSDYQRPRRHRNASHRVTCEANATEKCLDLDGVVRLLKAYNASEGDGGGGVNCSICGKLYRCRRVCFIKHLWEHSVYWDLFEGDKHHDRVLAIQAALILYNHPHGNQDAKQNQMAIGELLASLVVTEPHGSTSSSKKETKDINGNKIKASAATPTKRRSSNSKSPKKRRRLRLSSESTHSDSSASENMHSDESNANGEMD